MVQRCYGDADAAYFKCLEAEKIGLVAPTVLYYSLNRGRNVDPLYNEPADDPLYGGGPVGVSEVWGWFPAFEIQGAMEYTGETGSNPSVRDEGKEYDYDATLRIAASEWTRLAPSGQAPKEGDVCYVYSMYWDIVQFGDSGHVGDTMTFVGWVVKLKRRENFEPQRKLP
jgi:hypothetical protein